MALTPVELRHVSLPRGILGYRRSAVDRLLAEIVDSFETVWRDRADLSDKVEQLEGDLARHREVEALLRTTLVSAERAAHELRNEAKREARLILDEAHTEARSITRDAAAERERMVAESRRAQALLRSALATLEETDGSASRPRRAVPGNADPEAEAA